MKLSTSLLLLAGASTCVSAQWTDYLSKILGLSSGAAKQIPLKPETTKGHVEDRETLVARRVRNVTSENWLDILVPQEKETGAPIEWYYYFTSSAANGTKDDTFWDGVFNDTVYTLAKHSDVNFGRADCDSLASRALCRDLYLGSQAGARRQFYHLVAYPDKSIEIRELPWNMTAVEAEEQVGYYTQFYSNKEWKNVEAWTGPFNPINGTLRDARPYISVALQYYGAMPQWVPMILISFLGRTIMTKLSRRATEPAHAGTPPQRVPQAAS